MISTKNPRPIRPVYQLKITLKGIRPPIWRRIQVVENISLYNLHSIIQVVMGWEDDHLHEFNIGRNTYGASEPDLDPDVKNDKRAQLSQVVSSEKAKFEYIYDFGDYWQHEVLVEKILAADPMVRYPICLKGKRACPPEDCGGIWGYEGLLAAMQDPEDERSRELLDWLGPGYDPEGFDLEATIRELKSIR